VEVLVSKAVSLLTYIHADDHKCETV